jgi:hypothetical protein
MSSKWKQKTKQNTRVYVEIQGTWSMQCMVIPVITEATGTVTKKKLKEKSEIQTTNPFNGFPTKTAILGTSHITEKYYSLKLEDLAVGITICSREEVPGRSGL